MTIMTNDYLKFLCIFGILGPLLKKISKFSNVKSLVSIKYTKTPLLLPRIDQFLHSNSFVLDQLVP
jgi:hypothetical protein